MQITIRGHAFALSAPYTTGHQLTSSESAALNSLRAENIRNNVAKFVHRACEGLARGEHLDPEEHARVQEEIDEYSKTYVFTPRQVVPPKWSAFQATLRELARNYVREKHGLVRTDAELAEQDFPEYEALLLIAERRPELVAKAKERVMQLSAIAERALADL